MKRIAFAAVLLAALSTDAGASEIAAVLSAKIEPYETAFDAFARVCPANYWTVDLGAADTDGDQALRAVARKKPDLIVCFGSKALRAARKATDRIPIVFVMVLDGPASAGGNVAGASIRVDPALVMEYVSYAFPRLQTLGLVYDPEISGHVVERATRAAGERGFRLVARTASNVRETLTAIGELEGEVDGWWLLADRTTLSSESAEHVIMHGMRFGMPVIAPSRKYIERGAHVALIPSYGAIGAVGGEIALRILGGERPAAIGTVYASEFRICANARTGKDAGMRLEGSWAKNVDLVGE